MAITGHILHIYCSFISQLTSVASQSGALSSHFFCPNLVTLLKSGGGGGSICLL